MVQVSLNEDFSLLCKRACASYVPASHDSPVNTPKFLRLLQSLVHVSVVRLDRGLPLELTLLSAGMRSVVARIEFEADSFILKYFRRKDSATNSGGFGYLREKHGLVCLAELHPGSYPQLIAADDSTRLLIMEFVHGTSVASLLDDDAPAALAAWCGFWGGQVGVSGRSSEKACAEFARRIALADPDATAPGTLASPRMALVGLQKLAEARRVPGLEGQAISKKRMNELRNRIESILYSRDTRNLMLSSGDFSPHNVLITLQSSPKIQGIDMEGSAIHHRYLPLAEMLLGFPSAPLYPHYQKHFSLRQWNTFASEFYESAYGRPADEMFSDPTLQAAILTVLSIVAEQRPNRVIALPNANFFPI